MILALTVSTKAVSDEMLNLIGAKSTNVVCLLCVATLQLASQ